ncbi:alpha/beta hydrolase [Microcoleus sp. N3A4]|uniref:alpha/beta hydrolase n=1 Tax=Microcoleus sp. N3A4 TaxID=3055379 RepID=UPI002FD00CF9
MPNTGDLLAGEPIQLRRGTLLQACHTFGQAPPLVFLHGGLGNRYNWRSQYEFAVTQGWEALAYDLAGHGQSQPYPRYSIGRHRRDLSRLLQRFHIQAPVLCCHSYGVPIGLEWAQRHPVSAFVLICGGTHELDPWWEVPLMKFLTWGGRHLYRLTVVKTWTEKASSSHRHATVQQFLAEAPVPVKVHPYQALEPFWHYNFFHRRKTDRYLDIPTLVITGGRDPMFTAEMGKDLADHFHHSKHLHIPEAGHLVIAEFPEVVNQAIAQFLSPIR